MNLLLHYGTLWGLVLSTASIAVAVRLQQRQTNAMIYLELTGRLSQIFLSLSLEVRSAAIAGSLISEEQRAEFSVTSFEYFNLICSAYQLYEGRYFSGRLWKMLRREIDRNLATPLAQVEWERHKNQFATFPHFSKFVQQVQARGARAGWCSALGMTPFRCQMRRSCHRAQNRIQ